MRKGGHVYRVDEGVELLSSIYQIYKKYIIFKNRKFGDTPLNISQITGIKVVQEEVIK